ncbi:MAG: hypothetical protein ABI432_11370 [Flavobacteriales bacterium]
MNNDPITAPLGERIARRRMWLYIGLGVLVLVLMVIGGLRFPSVRPDPAPEVKEAMQ